MAKIQLPTVEQGTGSGYRTLSVTQVKEMNLDGLTIQEALDQDIITELDPENMFREHNKTGDFYFVFNNTQAIKVSPAAIDTPDVDQIIGSLTIRCSVSTIAGEGKGLPFVRVCLPGDGLDLGDNSIGVKVAKAPGKAKR